MRTADQRPGELHARRQLHPRRGARAEELLRRCRLQRVRHRGRRRRRHGAGRVGARRPAAVRPVGGRHPPLRSTAPGHRLGAHPHARGVRASTTRWRGRSRSTTAAARAAPRRCTTGCSRRARASARSSAGNGRTGSPTSPLGETPDDEYTYGRQNWFAAVGREHRACREAAVLIDQTSFAKFALKGPDALAALDWICANDVRQAGRLASRGVRAVTHRPAAPGSSHDGHRGGDRRDHELPGIG